MAKNIWRGDCQAVAQVTDVTFANIEASDRFTLTINRKDITVITASVSGAQALLESVVNQFVSAIGQYSHATIPEFFEVSAATLTNSSGVITGLRLTGPTDGKPVTITGSTSDAGNLSISVTEVQKGDAGQNHKQAITLDSDVSGGTFTLTFIDQATGAIAWNAAAATVQTALEALSNIGVGDVTVTGNAGGPWTVEFTGQYANGEVQLLVFNGASLTVTGGYDVLTSTVRQGDPGLNHVQKVSHPGTGGTFTLTFDGQVTGAIAYNASAAAIVTALEALSNIAVGDVAVTKPGGATTWYVEFKGAYKNTTVAMLVGTGTNLTGAAQITVTEKTRGSAGANHKYKLQFTTVRPSESITFTNPNTGQRSDKLIAVQMGVAQMQEALESMPSIGLGNVLVTVTTSSNSHPAYHIEFLNGLGAQDLTASTYSATVFNGQGLEETPVAGTTSKTQRYTLTEVTQGNATTVNEVQTVLLSPKPTGGTFTLTFRGQVTGAIAFDATAATIDTALEALTTIDTVTVTRTDTAAYTLIEVTFTAPGSENVPMMIAANSLTGGSVAITTYQAATDPTNELQSVELSPLPAGGTFTLTHAGVTTAAIAYNATAATVESALETALGTAFAATGPAGGPWQVEFQGTNAALNVALLSGSGASLSGSTGEVVTSQEAEEPVNEIQQVEILGGPSGGTFTLTFDDGSGALTTAAIVYNASALQIKNAMIALANVGVNDVSVEGNNGGPWTLSFQGGLAAEDFALMTGNAGSLTAGGGTQTISLNETTSPTGPNWVSKAENWSANAIPVNSDDVIFEENEIDAKYGLEALSAVTLASLRIKSTYTGKIGLPTHNGSYFEYRTTALAIGSTLTVIGEGDGDGSPMIKLNNAGVQTDLQILGTASPASGQVSVWWKGTHASNVVRIYQGKLGIAWEADSDTAAVATLQMGWQDSQQSDVAVYGGSGATIVTLEKQGGVGYFAKAPTTTITNYAGELRCLDGAITTALIYGGQFFYLGYDTITMLRGGTKAELLFHEAMKACTVTDCVLEAGAVLRDPHRRVVFTNPLQLNRCSLADVTLELGTHIKLAPTAGA